MNQVALIGRLTRDPELRYIPNSEMAVATFSIAIDRMVGKDKEKQADFPRITVFGKSAENCEKYLEKGRLVGITGRIQTGSYKDKEGKTIYTTDVVADRVEFLEWGEKKEKEEPTGRPTQEEKQDDAPEGFQTLDDDIPF